LTLPIVGGYAEYVILSSNELVPVPPGLDHAEAVGLILNYTIAYQMLHRCADIRSGETILIHGATGGVSTTPIGEACEPENVWNSII
jgi:NADPH2:quinone reductase